MDKNELGDLLVGEVEKEDIPILKPILYTSKRFYLVVFILSVIILIGVYAWILQLKSGLGITGLNQPIFWGIYITNFVFFIGISHAGTLISAILRLSRAEWRRAITRSAEVITVLVLFFGVFNIITDLGQPGRMMKVIFNGKLVSPLLWDVISISIYFTASAIYLYLPLIPDIALMRDKLKGKTRRFFYKILALNWRGTEKQWKILQKAIGMMAVIIIPIAVSVHTVVSYVFCYDHPAYVAQYDIWPLFRYRSNFLRHCRFDRCHVFYPEKLQSGRLLKTHTF